MSVLLTREIAFSFSKITGTYLEVIEPRRVCIHRVTHTEDQAIEQL